MNFKDRLNEEDKKEIIRLENHIKKFYGIEISNEEYHASEGLSRSGIVKLIESPWHYYKHYLAPDKPKFEETEAMKVGTAIHMAILEPDLFNTKYIKFEGDGDRRSKEFKAFAKEYEGQNLIILKKEEYQDIINARDAVYSDLTAMQLIQGGINERSFYYYDKELDLLFKFRPDCLSKLAMCDIKKTANASKYKFEKDAITYGYNYEAAFYLRYYKLITGIDLQYFVFIAVENKYPYQVNCYMYEPEDLKFTNLIIDEAIHKYIECKQKNEWPKLLEAQNIQTIKIPDYIKLRKL